MTHVSIGVFAVALGLACQRSVEAPPVKPVERLTPLTPTTDGGLTAREAAFEVGPFTPFGPPLPPSVPIVDIAGAGSPPGAEMVLRFDADTYLAQAASLLASLDDRQAKVWFHHPDIKAAYQVRLRDEASFGAWLDDPTPGKVRVVHRADGFELQTNMGKLPGFDAKGPTVPLRGGQLDLPLLQQGLERLKSRFKGDAQELCFVPSYGMELQQVIRAMAANAVTPETAHFERLCLVYPRPRARDGG